MTLSANAVRPSRPRTACHGSFAACSRRRFFDSRSSWYLVAGTRPRWPRARTTPRTRAQFTCSAFVTLVSVFAKRGSRRLAGGVGSGSVRWSQNVPHEPAASACTAESCAALTSTGEALLAWLSADPSPAWLSEPGPAAGGSGCVPGWPPSLLLLPSAEPPSPAEDPPSPPGAGAAPPSEVWPPKSVVPEDWSVDPPAPDPDPLSLPRAQRAQPASVKSRRRR